MLQAVLVDRTLYISGQLGMSSSGVMVTGGVAEEATQALQNIGNILSAAGGGKFRYLTLSDGDRKLVGSVSSRQADWGYLTSLFLSIIYLL